MKEGFGYDYGIKPRVMAVSDIEFPEIMHESFQALAYAQIDHFGVIVNPPLLGLVFSDELSAKKCFGKFKQWVEQSNDGDAVGIGFIEFQNGDYGMCIYPESSFLIDRMFSRSIQEEVTPIEFKVGYLKKFPQSSEGFRWFKSIVKSNPFVIAPVTQQGGPIMDMAFRKLQVKFYSEGEIPKHSMERALLDISNGMVKNEPEHAILLNERDVRARRKFQLDRFFPVTQELFKKNKSFQSVYEQLQENGYSELQILQAVCNLTLIYRSPEIFSSLERVEEVDTSSDEKIDIIKFLDFLASHFESLEVELPPREMLDVERIKEQICLDSKFLLDYFIKDNDSFKDMKTEDLQAKIIELGLS